MSQIISVPLSEIDLKASPQLRDGVDSLVVGHYCALLARNSSEDDEEPFEFPPITAFKVGERYIVADGHHRVHAYRQGNLRTHIPAILLEGDADEIEYRAILANGNHGKPLNNAEKRRRVERALKCSRFVGMSDRKIALALGVSQPFVGGVRCPKPKDKAEESDNGYHPPIVSSSEVTPKAGKKPDGKPDPVKATTQAPQATQASPKHGAEDIPWRDADTSKPPDGAQTTEATSARAAPAAAPILVTAPEPNKMQTKTRMDAMTETVKAIDDAGQLDPRLLTSEQMPLPRRDAGDTRDPLSSHAFWSEAVEEQAAQIAAGDFSCLWPRLPAGVTLAPEVAAAFAALTETASELLAFTVSGRLRPGLQNGDAVAARMVSIGAYGLARQTQWRLDTTENDRMRALARLVRANKKIEELERERAAA